MLMINNGGGWPFIAPSLRWPLHSRPRDAIKTIEPSAHIEHQCDPPRWPAYPPPFLILSIRLRDRSIAPPLFSGGAIQWRGIKTPQPMDYEASGIWSIGGSIVGGKRSTSERFAPRRDGHYRGYRDYVVRSNKFQRRWKLDWYYLQPGISRVPSEFHSNAISR